MYKKYVHAHIFSIVVFRIFDFNGDGKVDINDL